jgi:hypothetical protein
MKVAKRLYNMPPKPELTSDQGKQVVSQLLLLLQDGNQPPKLKHGALTMVTNNFNVKPQTAGKIWKRTRLNYEDPSIGAFHASPCKKNCGREQKYNSVMKYERPFFWYLRTGRGHYTS